MGSTFGMPTLADELVLIATTASVTAATTAAIINT
jgi:hypothetical protein